MADFTVCGIALEVHHAGTKLELWQAQDQRSSRLQVSIERKWREDSTVAWNCQFRGLECWVDLVVEGTFEQARVQLEAAVLKDFGHKLALMRWLLEQKA